ncbi:MAG: DUF1328 domain-containing protein [Planctomycetes bacterium]|nr:DUF1328 domain-containing protein [Planctomycetota bacterium]
MLGWSLLFLLLALVAGAFGFFGVAGASYTFAKVLFFIFLALFVISLFTGRGELGRPGGLAP